MSSESRLLVIELLVEPAIAHHKLPRENNGNERNGVLQQFSTTAPPYPLLEGWGTANRYSYLQGVELLSVMNTVNRWVFEQI